MKEIEYSKEYLEGINYFNNNSEWGNFEDNPYDSNTFENFEWDKGYDDAYSEYLLNEARQQNELYNIGIILNEDGNKYYTEDFLLKAIKYSCSYQKACDYHLAGQYLINDYDITEKDIIYLLDELANTDNNSHNEIIIEDIIENL